MLVVFINVAIKHCHINKIFYSRFARPLRGNRKTWQLLLRQVHVFQIGKEIFTCRSNNRAGRFLQEHKDSQRGKLMLLVLALLVATATIVLLIKNLSQN